MQKIAKLKLNNNSSDLTIEGNRLLIRNRNSNKAALNYFELLSIKVVTNKGQEFPTGARPQDDDQDETKVIPDKYLVVTIAFDSMKQTDTTVLYNFLRLSSTANRQEYDLALLDYKIV